MRGAVLATVVVFGLLALLPGVLTRHEVRDRGLLVAGLGRRTVVPWDSIDPGTVRVTHRFSLLGGRADHATSDRTYRVGLARGTVLALEGLTYHRPLTGPSHRWYFLGTPRPEELAAAIERAMVAADHPAAAGLADRARREAVTVSRSGPDPFPPRASIRQL